MRFCCSLCPPGTTYGAAERRCPTHFEPLVPCPEKAESPAAEAMASGPEPAAAQPSGPLPGSPRPADGLSWEKARCWNCDTEAPDSRNSECLRCGKALVPPRLVLTVSTETRTVGTIELACGQATLLGRSGPHARMFEPLGNVSRSHARVGVDADGSAWIEPLNTPNGTFHGPDARELPPNAAFGWPNATACGSPATSRSRPCSTPYPTPDVGQVSGAPFRDRSGRPPPNGCARRGQGEGCRPVPGR